MRQSRTMGTGGCLARGDCRTEGRICMAIVELDNVIKTYHIGSVETRALDGVSLGIADGEFTALVGPSGSGKTTLLQLMGCLDRPDSGIVRVNGKDVTRLNAAQRADM